MEVNPFWVIFGFTSALLLRVDTASEKYKCESRPKRAVIQSHSGSPALGCLGGQSFISLDFARSQPCKWLPLSLREVLQRILTLHSKGKYKFSDHLCFH